jgi:hypothetical protein
VPISATTAETTVEKILSEDVITFADARKEIGQLTGRRPDKSSMTRWAHRGVGGVRLEAVRIGGATLVTSRQAVHRFIVARTAKSIGNQTMHGGGK